tara:strand:+ start:289 stop:570 length:282 start_codon:yes stop_codon:yes gene_type:complete
MVDNINPDHYRGRVECIDAIEQVTSDLVGVEATDTGNVIKYIWRWKKKNGVEDLLKAQWYLQHLIQHISEDEELKVSMEEFMAEKILSEDDDA